MGDGKSSKMFTMFNKTAEHPEELLKSRSWSFGLDTDLGLPTKLLAVERHTTRSIGLQRKEVGIRGLAPVSSGESSVSDCRRHRCYESSS